MKQYARIVLLGAVLAVTVGMLGFYGISATSFGLAQPASITSYAPTMGHVTLALYDADGNIKAYRQTDNTIVNEGDNCMSSLVFDLTSGASCSKPTQKFDIMAIGTGGGACGAQPAQTTVGLTTEISTPARGNATTAVLTAATGTNPASVQLQKAFAFTSTLTVDEAGVFNSQSTTTDDMISNQCFADINVLSGDSLTVTWTFAVGPT